MAEVDPAPRIDAAPQVFADIHEGDRGSRVLGLSCGDPQALRGLVDVLGTGFRKVWFDLVGGFAEFMTISLDHGLTSSDAQNLVLALCHVGGLDVVNMKDATIKVPGGDREGNPDESFLIGTRAAAFRKIELDRGMTAAIASIEGQQADLAIEVEHTHRRAEKIALYGASGVKELWDLATEAAGRAPAIYDLQAEGGPRQIERSQVLLGARAKHLPAAATELKRLGGPLQFASRMGRGEPVDRRLLNVAGVQEPA